MDWTCQASLRRTSDGTVDEDLEVALRIRAMAAVKLAALLFARVGHIAYQGQSESGGRGGREEAGSSLQTTKGQAVKVADQLR